MEDSLEIKSRSWEAMMTPNGKKELQVGPYCKGHYQSKVFVCVSMISRRMRIFAQMRSIGF